VCAGFFVGERGGIPDAGCKMQEAGGRRQERERRRLLDEPGKHEPAA